MSISSAYLIYSLERYIGSVWIGYYHEPYSTFKFVDQSSAAHTYWGSGQPSRQLGQRSCTQANATGSNFGVWDDVDCAITNPFICEIYQGTSTYISYLSFYAVSISVRQRQNYFIPIYGVKLLKVSFQYTCMFCHLF